MSNRLKHMSAGALGWSNAQQGARAFMPPSHPLKLLGGSMAATDLVVTAAASITAFAVRHGSIDVPPTVALVTLCSALLTFNVFRVSGCYKRHLTAPLASQFGRMLQAWSAVFGFLVILAFVTRTSDEFSRTWAVGWYGGALAGFMLVRVAVALRVERWRRSGRLAYTVAVIDLDGHGRDLAGTLLRSDGNDARLVGVFHPAPAGAGHSSVADLVDLSRKFRIDEVLISVSGHADLDLVPVIAQLETIPANVRLRPGLPAMALASPDASLLFGQPVLTVSSRPLDDWARIVKRAEDVVLSLAALVFVAPLLALIALAIKLDTRGPALFRQERHGFNNNVITIYKFRTMAHRAAAEPGVPQARRSDPRVTTVGRFLRRTSLDELPQLINVLKGEMSLVGPRPHAVAHNEQYAAVIDGYLGRHRVQPGITGWAQIHGLRGETDTLDKMQRRVEHDLAYTRNWSLRLDLKILAMTVLTTVFDRNAY